MLAFKKYFLFLAFCVIIFFPEFGKCAPKESDISNAVVPNQDEATICLKTLEKGEIGSNNIEECIRELREKNGVGTFISVEKALGDLISRFGVEKSQTSRNILELADQILITNRKNPGCPSPIWMPMGNGEIPIGALSIYPYSKVYMARAHFREEFYRPGPKFSIKVMPGKVKVGQPAASIPDFPKKLSFFEYEVLIIPSEAVEWVPFKNFIPKNAIIGGYEKHLEKEDIYIGRVYQAFGLGLYLRDEDYGVGPILIVEGVYKLITTSNCRAYDNDKFEILVLKNNTSCLHK